MWNAKYAGAVLRPNGLIYFITNRERNIGICILPRYPSPLWTSLPPSLRTASTLEEFWCLTVLSTLCHLMLTTSEFLI